jgi:hypothetical protein
VREIVDERELDSLIARYVAMWHEPDPERRRQTVRDLFAVDAENYTRRTVSRGIEPAGNTDAHHHLVKFFWRMRPASGGAVVSVRLDVFLLAPAGRIQALYQFIEPAPR